MSGATPDPAEWARRDARVLWHPFTQHGLEGEPLPVVRAEGASLFLQDGSRVLDAISSWWCCLHGHGEPTIAAAIAAQARTLDHVLFAGATHPPAVQLAERLLALAPPGLSRVFYSDDGSTAVEVALKAALQAHAQAGRPQRTRFVAFEGGYHGDTVGAMSLGDPDPYFRPYAPLLFDVLRLPLDAERLEAALQEEGERVAAIVLEPLVQGAAGMRMHPAAFVRQAAALARRHGAYFVADEVMTGFGRTGAAFACTAAGVSPDLMCVAKGLTGGTLPLSATLATEEIFQAFWSEDRARALFHGHTFTGNPIACAAALASLDLFAERDTPRRLDAIGETIEHELRERLAHRPALLSTLRRQGGIVALDLERPPLSPLPLRRAALARGVLLRPLGSALYAMPPACTSEDEARVIAGVMAEVAS